MLSTTYFGICRVLAVVRNVVKLKMYKAIILPVVLHVCEIWSHTLRKDYRLRIFGNRVLRRVFELRMDKMTGGWIIMLKLILAKWVGGCGLGCSGLRYEPVVGGAEQLLTSHKGLCSTKLVLMQLS